jgi:hypothetical protein
MKKIGQNAQSFWLIILKIIITLGVYFWVYLFKTLDKIVENFTFKDDEIKPVETKAVLWIFLWAWIFSGIVTFINELPLPIILSIFFERLYFPSSIFCLGLMIVFWDMFIRVIKNCQIKKGSIVLNKSIFWIFILSLIIMYLFYLGSFRYVPSSLIIAVVIIYLVFFYYLVRQINKIWTATESKVLTPLSLDRMVPPLIISIISWVFIIWGIEAFVNGDLGLRVLVNPALRVSIFKTFGKFDVIILIILIQRMVFIISGTGMLKGFNQARLLYLFSTPILILLNFIMRSRIINKIYYLLRSNPHFYYSHHLAFELEIIVYIICLFFSYKTRYFKFFP